MKEVNSIPTSQRDLTHWTQKIFPVFKFAIRSGYLSFEVKGAENILTEEPVLYAANHSSWLALDGLLIPYAIYQVKGTEHIPYGIIHDILFKLPFINRFLEKCGSIPVSWVRDLRKLPSESKSFGIFPEGDSGNSKPFWQAYRMKKWKRGFIRLAITRKIKIIPVAVQGLEESMPVAFTLKSLKSRWGTFAGFPLFPIPLPTRCQITFCKPIDLTGYPESILHNRQELEKIADEIRSIVQNTLDQETSNRPLARFSKLISKLAPTASSS